MPRTQAENLLRELAGRTGGPAAELDAEGLARVTLDGQPLAFLLAEEAETLAVLAALGELPGRPDRAGPELQTLALEKALKADFLWQGTAGGVLGLGRDGRFNLAYRLGFPLDRPGEEERDYDDTLLELLPQLAGAATWARDLTVPVPAGDI